MAAGGYILLAGGAAIVVAALLWRLVVRPERILYALALVVSLVGLNVHVGATLYLSRLLLATFVFGLLLRWMLRLDAGVSLRCDPRLLVLLGGSVLVQAISALLSNMVADSLRQLLIYGGEIAIFIMVLSLATSSARIIRALRLYLLTGVAQGLYGIYQVMGGPRGWPTYQTLLAGLPTANDRTEGGYYFTPAYDAFRAVGFFPADVSHYSGYMAGILILALAFVAYDRRAILPYLALLFGGAGLALSLSRSGILAFVAIGLPVLLVLLWSRRFVSARKFARVASRAALVAAVVFGAATAFRGIHWWTNLGLPDVPQILASRLADLLAAGESTTESMVTHIETRMLALDAFVSSPLIGVGTGITATPWYSERYQQWWYGAHSHHFNILGETGLLGAGLEWTFMAVVFLHMLRGLRRSPPRSEQRAVLVGLLSAYITIILGNFFYAYYTNDFVWFLMACGLALSRTATQDARACTLSAGSPAVRRPPPAPAAVTA